MGQIVTLQCPTLYELIALGVCFGLAGFLPPVNSSSYV